LEIVLTIVSRFNKIYQNTEQNANNNGSHTSCKKTLTINVHIPKQLFTLTTQLLQTMPSKISIISQSKFGYTTHHNKCCDQTYPKIT
jgi:hypothetical protein